MHLPSPNCRPARAGAAGLLLLGPLLLGPSGAAGAARSQRADSAVAISYSGLLDRGAVVRTGERLGDVLRKRGRRAAVEPFVERYSSLLPYAVALLQGPDPEPQASLAERYPPGSAQPAWAALLRAGRIQVTTDGRGRARVFVPGDDPRDAYRRHYGLLRHPLSVALAEAGVPLQVDVFAYRNDYGASELRLNPAPYRFRARAFPPGRDPLDLESLERFFRQGGRLEGAELAPGDGLVLYASRGAATTLAGSPLALSDLAVAYRAVFHAGESEAFVSLDPNADPTVAAVSFGGRLEDTRLGAVVLAADKRFKTVCAGLDPETYSDIRAETRRAIPGFLTNSERAFLAPARAADAGWVGTRFWFYPGTSGIESDRRFAAIVRPRFRADAERFDEGYFDRSSKARKAALAPEIRANIALLNGSYASYAAAFPEIGELDAVARLMLLCSWLSRADAAWLDLDGLLAVELPAASTPRVVPRLLTATTLARPQAGAPDAAYVTRGARVSPLNSALEQTVEGLFRNPMHLALYLAWREDRDDASARVPEAQRLFSERRAEPARALLRSERDLRAFLRYAAETSGVLAGAPGTPAPLYSLQHAGGISMNPRLFQVRSTRTSPALERLKEASRRAGTTWGSAGWLRSRPARAEAARAEPGRHRTAHAPTAPAPRRSRKPESGPAPPPVAREPLGQASPPVRTPAAVPRTIEVPLDATGAPAAVGRLLSDGKIVFTRAQP